MASTHIPSSSSTSTTPTLWDVFLSFRGIDTRTGFTSHLYDALNRNGIRTFMDDPELRSGELISSALLDAIRKSKVYVLVLSQNYASSSWCLDELVEILKCFKSMGKLVVPVFYKIDPSVVRHQIGSFKSAFEKHENVRFVGMDKINQWRLTLSQVAEISGHHVDETRSEVEIINEVVDAVLREINPITINVAKYPVGIDSRVADIKPLLTSSTQGVHYIGIWGMGGVGKTTLAKAVYNEISRNFEGSSFLANITEVSGQPNGQERLQEQLVANVLKAKKSPIHSVDHGIELIKERISSKKVLIVVDDLNAQKQLDSLGVDSFAPGSVIILTTRHEDLLTTVGVKAEYCYMLNVLVEAESRQLFNRHAFGDKMPTHTLTALSEEVIRHSGGLPLALEIFGSNLRNQTEGEWERFISQLQKVLSPDIQKKLMISFQSLVDPTLKDIFLDIACFFIGDLKDEVVDILGSFYADVKPSIDRLKSRCLITINENNQFLMHNLLQDMGREIACNSYPKDEPEKHSRLFQWQDICNVLDNNEGTEAIKGMVYYYGFDADDYYQRTYDTETFDTETFKRMTKLRFLKIKDVNLRGSFGQIFKELRWLHWLHYPLESLPSSFCPKKLVILQLPKSNIRIWEHTMDLKNLKILDLSRSHGFITTPNFSKMPFLETINLRLCIRLEKVDETIGALVNLVSLDLKYCQSLRSLPDTICKLRALEILDIGHCYSLEALPTNLGNIESLVKLNIKRQAISKLPDSIGLLHNLVELIIDDNKNLETIPHTISNLRSLAVLCISGCEKLEELSDLLLPPNLIELRASGCRSIFILPNLSNLQKLEKLYLGYCNCLVEIEGLGELISITELDLRGCTSMKRLPNLSNLKHLEELNLSYCHNLIEIDGLEELIPIKELKLESCTSMKRLPKLSKLKSLEKLDLRYCASLTEIEGLEELSSIRRLHLQGCMLGSTLSKSLFQIYSEFGNEINIHIETQRNPDWIRHPSSGSSDVRVSVSNEFLGLLLSLACDAELVEKNQLHRYTCTIRNKTSDLAYISSNTYDVFNDEETVMVIVPVKHLVELCAGSDESTGDTTLCVTATLGKHNEMVSIGVHPLYKLPKTHAAIQVFAPYESSQSLSVMANQISWASAPITTYDVFLSYKSQDMRSSFTSQLNAQLRRTGLRTFLDDLDYCSGEKIRHTILESKTYIVVFSENYASSSWYLDVLVNILECSQTMGRLIIPVFYNIGRLVVRDQTESYRKAFEKHEVRFPGVIERVNKWGLTLTQVADFSGYHVSGTRNRFQLEQTIIDDVIDVVLHKLNRTRHFPRRPIFKMPDPLRSEEGITTPSPELESPGADHNRGCCGLKPGWICWIFYIFIFFIFYFFG